MEGATHFIEVWKKKGDKEEKYSKHLPIADLPARLAITAKMRKYKTLFVWFIKPKTSKTTNQCTVHDEINGVKVIVIDPLIIKNA